MDKHRGSRTLAPTEPVARVRPTVLHVEFHPSREAPDAENIGNSQVLSPGVAGDGSVSAGYLG